MKQLKLTATGDSLINLRHRNHPHPGFTQLIQLIRNADCAFTNLETTVHDYGPTCYPAAECGGTYTRAEPRILDELTWMGFNIMSTANNHSLDYMYGGLLETIRHLEERDIPYAGTGVNLAEATEPSYLEVPGGRVALISAASTFAGFGRAGHQRKDMKGRPGLNPIRYESYYECSEETLESIKRLAEELDLPKVVQEEGSFHFLGKKFVVGDSVGLHTRPHRGDMERNLEAIRDAAKQADWVLFSHHAHESRPHDDDRPAEFIEEFARAAIDAGAHCYIGHGHHAMRGIELRDGRPIFYSLGNFIFQNETVFKMPADFYERYDLDPFKSPVSEAYDARQKAKPKPGRRKYKWFTEDKKYWVSFVPQITFQGDEVEEVRLHPIELGFGEPRSIRGRPRLAQGEEGEHILRRLQELSKPYGTIIRIEDGVGYLQL